MFLQCFYSEIAEQHITDTIMSDILGIHLGQLWRLQISCESMACVIAQQRVQPIAVIGNPLTEHNQLFERAYVRADQQVLPLTKLDGSLDYNRTDLRENSSVWTLYLQDAQTFMRSSQRSAVTGKVRLLTLFLGMICILNRGGTCSCPLRLK